MKSNDLKMDKADNFQYISGMYFWNVISWVFAGCMISVYNSIYTTLYVRFVNSFQWHLTV